MFALLTWLTVHWYYDVAVVLSFLAVIGFLTFLRGFLLGFGHIIYINTHAEHLGEAQIRAIRGTLIMVNVFVWWVLFRGVLALLGLTTVNASFTIWVLSIYVLILLFAKLKSAKKGGHH